MFSGEKGVLGTNGLRKKGFKSKISWKLLANDTTDDDLDNFAKERFKGEKSIWKPITQTKLHTIGSNIKDASVKIKDQLVPVKGHKLFSIFLKVRRTRHDTDLPSYLGDYEFLVVPRSFCTPNEQFYKSTNKSVILNNTENLTNQSQGAFVSFMFISKWKRQCRNFLQYGDCQLY